MKKLSMNPIKFYSQKDSKIITQTIPPGSLRKYTTILYFPLIRVLKLCVLLDPTFLQQHLVHQSQNSPCEMAKKIFNHFMKSPTVFIGLFSDGLNVFTHHRTSVTPTIGFFFKSLQYLTADEQRDNQGLLKFFVNSIFTLPTAHKGAIDHLYVALVDELIFLMKNGVKLPPSTNTLAITDQNAPNNNLFSVPIAQNNQNSALQNNIPQTIHNSSLIMQNNQVSDPSNSLSVIHTPIFIKVAALFIGSDMKQKKEMNLTPTWQQNFGCDHCWIDKKLDYGITWSGRCGKARQNPTISEVSEKKAKNSTFQDVPYYVIRLFFPLDLMHH